MGQSSVRGNMLPCAIDNVLLVIIIIIIFFIHVPKIYNRMRCVTNKLTQTHSDNLNENYVVDGTPSHIPVCTTLSH